MFNMETENERYERYFKQNGWFFASNDEMERWAREQLSKKNLIKPLTDLVPSIFKMENGRSNWRYAYIPIHFDKIEDLQEIFTHEALNIFGIYFNLNYSI